jgi:alkylhydroperoxidase/carboxymuconolactone decarboxylase family protein YurZ
LDAFDRLAKYCPEVVEGYVILRQGSFSEAPAGMIPRKYKEILAVAIECARVVPAVGHARRAIETGATPHEIAEAISMCIQLGGMVTYMHSGRHALEAAEERAKELARESRKEGV